MQMGGDKGVTQCVTLVVPLFLCVLCVLSGVCCVVLSCCGGWSVVWGLGSVSVCVLWML